MVKKIFNLFIITKGRNIDIEKKPPVKIFFMENYTPALMYFQHYTQNLKENDDYYDLIKIAEMDKYGTVTSKIAHISSSSPEDEKAHQLQLKDYVNTYNRAINFKDTKEILKELFHGEEITKINK